MYIHIYAVPRGPSKFRYNGDRTIRDYYYTAVAPEGACEREGERQTDRQTDRKKERKKQRKR